MLFRVGLAQCGFINDNNEYSRYVELVECDCNGKMGIYCKKCRGNGMIIKSTEDFLDICWKCSGYGEVFMWVGNELIGRRTCEKCNGRGATTWLDDFIH